MGSPRPLLRRDLVLPVRVLGVPHVRLCEYSEYPLFTPVSRLSAAGSPGVAGAKGERGAPGECSEYPTYPHAKMRTRSTPVRAPSFEAGITSVWVLGIPGVPECVGSPLRAVCVSTRSPRCALEYPMLRAVYLSPV